MAIQNYFIFLFLSLVQAQNYYCPGWYCNSNSISYPFWIQDQQLPQNCAPIGFNLSCNAQKKTILSIPYSGDFYVTSLSNFFNKRIELVDPDNCLPRRLMSLNLSSSPFRAASNWSYTFLSCPKGYVSRYVLDCISNATTDIMAISKEADVVRFPKCRKIFTLQIPDSDESSYAFPVKFALTWDVPAATGSGKEEVAHTAIVLSLVAAAAIIPVVIVVISCCICMLRRDDSQSLSSRAGSSDTVAAGPLDRYTIETYRKITIGQSCRVEGPNDITCTICLVDYVPNDTIRFMPECQHCFHVECIDKWLSIKGKCPICRTS